MRPAWPRTGFGEALQSRRTFLASAGALAALAACHAAPVESTDDQPPRLHLRVRAPSRTPVIGLQPIGLRPPLPAIQRDGLLYVPQSYRVGVPMPLVVLLHGNTGSGQSWFGSYAQRAEAAHVIMLAPDSRSFTWDATQDEPFGPDIRFLEDAIASTFDRCSVDPTRLALVGFSDGASYALSVGLANGDVFRRVVAYSPGFVATDMRNGQPELFIAHGIDDDVLPIGATSRQIVPSLRAAGYTVDYSEFDGRHELPSPISDLAMAWLGRSFAR